MKTLNIHIHFLEPFFLAPWFENKQRNRTNPFWLRTRSFATLHKDKNGHYRPYIRGTLLRSAVIREVERELVRTDGQWQKQPCCPGEFYTEQKSNKQQYRKRPALKWASHDEYASPCKSNKKTRDKACPLCLLLNRYKKDKDTHDVSFGNLNLEGEPLWENIEDFAKLRTHNRVDNGATGKAQDYYQVYEVSTLADFYGKITIAEDLPKSEEVQLLLKQALGSIKTLAGAICTIEVSCNGTVNEEFGQNTNQTDSVNSSPTADNCSFETFDCLKEISSSKLRSIANAILALRSQSPENIKLPKGRIHSSGRKLPHHIWDIKLTDDTTLRAYLTEQFDRQQDQKGHRLFCEQCAGHFFLLSKGEQPPIAGTASEQPDYTQVVKTNSSSDNVRKITGAGKEEYEWIITGTLTAKAPFFIPDETNGSGHMDRIMLLTEDLHYRLPRTALRGVLRRDLNEVSEGQGCRAELDPTAPCTCPVCLICNNLLIMDTRSEQDVPPDVRTRTRIAHHHGIVQDGALFETEYGLEGTTFPFVLIFRGKEKFNTTLCTVLRWWEQENLFLGGDAGTGKGIFSLDDLSFYRWNLSKEEDRADYAEHCGYRNKLQELDSCAESNPDAFKKIEDGIFPYTLPAPPWQRVDWSLCFDSPVLTADPTAALVEEDSPDTIYFQKRQLAKNGEAKNIAALRGEGLRGLLRTAVARNTGEDLLTIDHEDCSCDLCQSFGNEHQAGKIRFGDMALVSEKMEKRIDHVSIDRFDGSVVEKFDDKPLVGSPKFTGSFWLHRDFQHTELLQQALEDMKNGVYPVGGKTGIGYGHISAIEIDKKFLSSDQRKIVEKFELETKTPSCAEMQLDNTAYYNPYYFIPVVKKTSPERTKEPVSRAVFDKDRYTGKIECSLTVKSPLLLPDVKDENPAKISAEGGHTTEDYKYPAFRLNETVMIPAAGIRAAISQTYEILTNSCFRIMDQKRTLSWRMDADKPEYKPGRVIEENGEIKIQPMGDIALRLPLYELEGPPEYNSVLRKLNALKNKALQENMDCWNSPWNEKTLESEKELFQRLLSRDLNEEEKKALLAGGLKKLEEITRCQLKKMKKLEADALNENMKRWNSPWSLKTLISKKKKYKRILGNISKDQEKALKKGGLRCLGLPNVINAFENDERKILEKVKKADKKIAEIAQANREYLQSIKTSDSFDKIIKGEEEVYFCVETVNADNEIFQVAKLTDDENQKKGFLKITGPNNANIKKTTAGNSGNYNEKWNNFDDISFRLTWKDAALQPNTQKTRYFPRPGFTCVVDKKKCTITKRCERVFISPESEDDCSNYLEVTYKVRERYKAILTDYVQNAKNIPKGFQTRLYGKTELQEGDLVYFLADGDSVTDISPVCISRSADDRSLGDRVPSGYQSCSHIYLGDDLNNLSASPFYREGYPIYGLCPACHLFGAQMHKGRLSFSFAIPETTEITTKKIILPSQERPRPSWVLPKEVKGNNRKVPGRKVYLRHDGWKKLWKEIKEENKHKGKNNGQSENKVIIEGIEQGTKFTFKVHFENLDEKELGMLLYCIELEGKMRHSLGRGKAFGFGQIKTKIDTLSFRHRADKWSSLETRNKDISRTKIVQKALSKYNKTTLLYLQALMTSREDISVVYPELEGTNGLPGYIELKKNKGYNPYRYLTITKENQKPNIFPWNPVPLQTGTVKFFNDTKGYGFIKRKGKEDIHVQRCNIVGGKSLEEGKRVQFDIGENHEGSTAINVKVIS